jgi:hypothetical protein
MTNKNIVKRTFSKAVKGLVAVALIGLTTTCTPNCIRGNYGKDVENPRIEEYSRGMIEGNDFGDKNNPGLFDPSNYI